MVAIECRQAVEHILASVSSRLHAKRLDSLSVEQQQQSREAIQLSTRLESARHDISELNRKAADHDDEYGHIRLCWTWLDICGVGIGRPLAVMF